MHGRGRGMITVYSKPDCVQCTATKRKLDALGIAYREVDLTQDAEAMASVTAWGYRQAPVVETGPDHHWSCNRTDLINRLLAP